MTTLDLQLSRPTAQSGTGDRAQRRLRFILDGQSVGYLTVTGAEAECLAEIISRGCRYSVVDFTLCRPRSHVHSGRPAAPTPNGDHQ